MVIFPQFNEQDEEEETGVGLYILFLVLSASVCGLANVVGQMAKDSAPGSVRVFGEMGFAAIMLLPPTLAAAWYQKELFGSKYEVGADSTRFGPSTFGDIRCAVDSRLP